MISNVLLLIFLGILIYYLTYPKHKDTFADTTKTNVSPIKLPITTAPQQVINTNNNSLMSANAPVPTIFSDPSRSPINTANNNNKNLNLNLNKDYQNPLLNFSGNIDGSIGADINSAFEPPSGYPQTPDVIDFNKNNVEKYNVKDYLPKDVNTDWFDTDFSQAQHIDDTNLINPDRFIIGVNTVSASLKSPSWDIRGTIPNPKYSISPFNNSSYEPDYNLKPLC